MRITSFECLGTFATFATWQHPDWYFRGVPRNVPGALEQLAVYRTLRFRP